MIVQIRYREIPPTRGTCLKKTVVKRGSLNEKTPYISVEEMVHQFESSKGVKRGQNEGTKCFNIKKKAHYLKRSLDET